MYTICIYVHDLSIVKVKIIKLAVELIASNLKSHKYHPPPISISLKSNKSHKSHTILEIFQKFHKSHKSHT